MPWYRRLRWRLIASQFVVALVGVAIMMLATRIIILRTGPDAIRPQLLALIANPQLIAETESGLIFAFRDAVLVSVAVAAVGAVAAGILSSTMIWRTIIAPLQQMTSSSRRIADGRYSERVNVPEKTGEAMAQLVINFNEMAEALQHVEEQRITLLNNISHELRTPLTGLKGYLEGLQDGLFPANEQTYGWMLQELERLNRLIEDINRLSQVEAGQISLNIQAFNLGELVQRVFTQMEAIAQGVAVDLVIDTPPEAVIVQADRDRTAQVLINLVNNALHYTPEGGRVTIGIRQSGLQAEVTVQDTGIGIPAEALPYLFERFYRVDKSRNRASGGSGIGLTISRHLIWAMGGNITAASAGPGLGSTFTFTLPVTDQALT